MRWERGAAESCGEVRKDLDETGAPVEVEVQVLDVADVAEGVMQVVLGRLLVQVGHKDDPALDC